MDSTLPPAPSPGARPAGDATPAVPSAVAAATPQEGAARLGEWGVIEALGEEAATFLNGQLTNSMLGLTAQRARLAGYCSPKGRLLASFVVLQPEPGRLWLACSADVLPATLKRLSMFVLRAKCKLSDASARLRVWGMVGAQAAQWLGAEAGAPPSRGPAPMPAGPLPAAAGATGHWARLPDVDGQARFLCLAAADGAPPPLPELSLPAWQWGEVRSAVPRVVAATVEHFVPQMVNLELVGGVDFQKGCYPGQEVVARSQYRGTLKRRMVLMNASGPLQPGAEVFHATDPEQPAGEVVLAAAGPLGWQALVEVKLAAMQAGLKFSSAGVDMEVTDLPYPLPVEAS